MTYVLELKPEVARALEAKAAQKGLKPEEFLEAMLVGNDAQTEESSLEEVRAMAAKLFDDRAPVYEALADGAK